MFATLAKYRHVFLVGVQSNLVYRWNFAVRGLFSLFHLVVVFTLWGAAFAGQTEIGGFDLRQTLTYFVILLPLNFMIGAFNEDYQVSEEIRNGLINQFLLKPVNYYAYRFSVFVAARLVSGVLVLLPLALAYPVLRDALVFPDDWALRLAYGLPAMLMSALIQFTIAYCFGLLTFWFLEIQSFVILSMAVEVLLGGQMFPLDLMPAWLFEISHYLPYFYMMYFPAAIFTGRIDIASIGPGLAIQACWVVVLLVCAQALWSRGLRRHTAVGG
ncbi:MAG: ABC-2 family transporter protein [Candidatus Didemnitutus sp.]|nr:ABC-2 family transporter protein [Candidatus Didemnitutus sp.]